MAGYREGSAYRYMHAFRAAAQTGLRNAMALEAMLQKTAIASEDCREGVAALMEKRKPQFKGR